MDAVTSCHGGSSRLSRGSGRSGGGSHWDQRAWGLALAAPGIKHAAGVAGSAAVVPMVGEPSAQRQRGLASRLAAREPTASPPPPRRGRRAGACAAAAASMWAWRIAGGARSLPRRAGPRVRASGGPHRDCHRVSPRIIAPCSSRGAGPQPCSRCSPRAISGPVASITAAAGARAVRRCAACCADL